MYINMNYCFTGGTLRNTWSSVFYLETDKTELVNYYIRALYRLR